MVKKWREVLHQLKFDSDPSRDGMVVINEGPEPTLGRMFFIPSFELHNREMELDRRALIDELWRREDQEKAKAESNATWDALKAVCGR